MVVEVLFFFFNDTATTEIYTLSLHDALPIYPGRLHEDALLGDAVRSASGGQLESLQERLDAKLRHLRAALAGDRKSTRLNSSHANISYAVFCLKKKKTIHKMRDLIRYVDAEH